MDDIALIILAVGYDYLAARIPTNPLTQTRDNERVSDILKGTGYGVLIAFFCNPFAIGKCRTVAIAVYPTLSRIVPCQVQRQVKLSVCPKVGMATGRVAIAGFIAYERLPASGWRSCRYNIVAMQHDNLRAVRVLKHDIAVVTPICPTVAIIAHMGYKASNGGIEFCAAAARPVVPLKWDRSGIVVSQPIVSLVGQGYHAPFLWLCIRCQGDCQGGKDNQAGEGQH